MHCGAGRICEVDKEGEPQCVCIPTCPVETESRRKVCSNHNETWTSDCAVYQQRCLCDRGDAECKGEQYKHVHIEYYGECREMKVRVKLIFISNMFSSNTFRCRNVRKRKWPIFHVVCVTGCSI